MKTSRSRSAPYQRHLRYGAHRGLRSRRLAAHGVAAQGVAALGSGAARARRPTAATGLALAGLRDGGLARHGRLLGRSGALLARLLGLGDVPLGLGRDRTFRELEAERLLA